MSGRTCKGAGRLTESQHAYYSSSEPKTAQDCAVVVVGESRFPVNARQNFSKHYGLELVQIN
jgi:hypothetical protein